MKKSGILFLLSLFFNFSTPAFAQNDVVLYDATGQFAGFLDPTANSIYLSSGVPVAYINRETGAIYGFNGKFLGWYNNGVVRDENGYIIGFSETSAPKTVILKRPSDIQFIPRPLPTPVQTQVIVTKPVFSEQISPVPFSSVYVYPPGSEPVR